MQYTRNMVTGASTADLGLVLVDARQGLTEQSRRHAVILSLLRVPHLVLAVNKMDLVDYSQEIYEKIHTEFTQFATKLNIPDLEVIPISALKGDNVVNRSENMAWYSGPTLMHHLEHVHVASDRDLVDVRFPVQYVVRPKSDEHHDYRGYGGMVAGGVLKPGDEVVVLPSGMTSRIAGIDLFDQEVTEAFPPMSVTVRLEDDVDVSRGDMIARVNNAPQPSQDIDAMVCWMTPQPLRPRQKLAIKHTTRTARALVKDIQYRLDVNTLHRDQETKELGLNEIGRIQLRTTQPLLCDPYSQEPHHRVVHPDRRGHRRHRRRRDDQQRLLTRPRPRSTPGAVRSLTGHGPADRRAGTTETLPAREPTARVRVRRKRKRGPWRRFKHFVRRHKALVDHLRDRAGAARDPHRAGCSGSTTSSATSSGSRSSPAVTGPPRSATPRTSC